MALNFSLFGILGLILYAGCIFHAIKTGRINYWLLILIFLPGLGSIAYLLIEVLPGMRNNRTARRALAGIGEALDPNRDLRESEASLEVADTADNKRHLAEERMKRGQWAEAEALYRSALVGPLAGRSGAADRPRQGPDRPRRSPGRPGGTRPALSREPGVRIARGPPDPGPGARGSGPHAGGGRCLARADRLHARARGAGALRAADEEEGRD